MEGAGWFDSQTPRVVEFDSVAMNKKLQRKLRDLGRAVFEAISESPDVGEALELIRAEGYSLSMQLKCEKGGGKAKPGAPEAGRPSIGRPVIGWPDSGGPDGGGPDGERVVRALPEHDPTFRIDGEDLSFLRSIGIDPTRRMRRRR